MAEEKSKKALMEWLLSDPIGQGLYSYKSFKYFIFNSFLRLAQIERQFNVTEVLCLNQLQAYLERTGAAQYPLQIGDDPQMSAEAKSKLVIFLVSFVYICFKSIL